MQFVRLVNKGEQDFDFHQSNQKRILPPGAEVMVPWDLACSLFGDPTTVDSPTDQARARSLKQSRGLFNYEMGKMTAEEWEERRPKVEVYDVETGNRVYMVLEDPDGVHAGNVPGGPDMGNLTALNVGALEAIIANQQKQMDAMQSMLIHLVGQQDTTGQSVTASQDGPGNDGNSSLPEGEAGDDEPQTPPSGPKPKGGKGGTSLAPPPDLT